MALGAARPGNGAVTTVLMIDDDERLAPPLAEYLSRYDIKLLSALHPDRGVELLRREEVDLVILDVMLPDRDGFDVCRTIRRHSEIPIIMLTARGDVMDRVVGLELGADDYMPKPFEPRELVARIHTILKRAAGCSRRAGVLAFADLCIDLDAGTVSMGGGEVDLTTTEYQLLVLLAKSPGKKFTRDEIMNHLKGNDVELFSRTVDIHVSRLRQKLKPAEPIQTVWGSGYRFVAAATS